MRFKIKYLMCTVKKGKNNWGRFKRYFFILNRKNILLTTKKLDFKKIFLSKIFKSQLFLRKKFISHFIRLTCAEINFFFYLTLKNIKKNLFNSNQFKREIFFHYLKQ